MSGSHLICICFMISDVMSLSDIEILNSFPPDSEEQQALITSIQDEDGYNWGWDTVIRVTNCIWADCSFLASVWKLNCWLPKKRYNPVLWGVPKGSYASNANGPCRIVEFRKMVQVNLLLSKDPTLSCVLMFILNRSSTFLLYWIDHQPILFNSLVPL